MKKHVIVSLLPILFCFNAYSQEVNQTDSSSHYKEWLNIQVGQAYKPYQMSGGISYNFGYDRWFYQAAINGTTNSLGFSGTSNYLNSIHVGIGQRLFDRWGMTSVFIGPSVNWGLVVGESYSENQRRNFVAAGIVADIQFIFKLVPEIGLGINLHSNFNREQSFSAVRMIFYIGNGK